MNNSPNTNEPASGAPVDEVEARLAEINAAMAAATGDGGAAEAASPADKGAALAAGMACPVDPAERAACEACQ